MITPFRPFDRVLSPFDLFEREILRAPQPRGAEPASAATDVWETPTTFEIEVDLPGLSDTDVSVSVTEDVLTIRAERKAAPARDNAKAHLRERRPHTFARQFALGQPIDADCVEASMKNGVLSVSVPKGKPQGARQVPVKVA